MIDVIIIGTVALFMYLGYRRGLLRMIFSLISFILAILLASYLFPIVAEWMMETPVYYALKDYIVRTMGLEDMVQAHSGEIITSLPLPDIILNFLYQHNTPNAFEILNVSTKTGYKLLNENKIQAFKIGRAFRIPKVHLFDYLKI